ncbi:MAG: protein kinase [Planctomycetia bacterium]|nr:protein kinase [Planctomycetia bacterium]
MITPEDLRLAQALLAGGQVSSQDLEAAIASLGGENRGRRLREVLVARGLLGAPGAADQGATLIPGSVQGPAMDRTVIAPRETVPQPKHDPAPPPAATSGRTLGRFQIVDEIARGGMGIVYRAWEPGLNRHVALKVLMAGQSASDDQVQRFLREARAAAGLQHPNIVQVFEVGEDAGSHWFAMELVDGSSLDRVVKQQGSFSPRIALRIVRDVARALHFAHQKGIVHRDVKPGNILLASMGKGGGSVTGDVKPMRVLLGDFGLARDASAGGGLTISGNLLGTPAYMSPEQASGRTRDVDARSDIFALGSVLYELLCGHAPFQGPSLGDVLSAIIAAEPPPLRKERPGLHRDIELVVAKAMAREKERRYQTAGEFADDIDRYLNGEAILAEAPSWADRVSRWVRTHAPLTAAGSVLVLAATAGGGFLWRRAVNAAADERRLDDDRRREAAGQVDAGVREALALAERGEFAEAEVRLGSVRGLIAGDERVEETSRQVRLLLLKRRVGEVVARANPGAEDLDVARSLLAANADLSGDAEIQRLARLVAGTCSWAFDTTEEGVDIDLGAADPGVFWDEESFPPLDTARAAGLCTPAGRAPLPVRDIVPGDVYFIVSRAGRVVRVVPAHFERNTSLVLEHRVLRVGDSEAATHRLLEEALAALRPGNTLLLEGGSYGKVEISGRPGVLVAAAPGCAPQLLNPTGDAFSAVASPGVRFRDLTAAAGTSSLGSLSGSHRASVIRCVSSGRLEGGGLNVADCRDWHVRDVVVRKSLRGGGFDAASTSDRGLALRCTFDGGGWSVLGSLGSRLRFVQCRVSGGEKAAAYVPNPGCEFVECEFRDCPHWGIVAEQSNEDLLVRDCRFVRCGHLPSTTAFPGALVIRSTSSTVVHNTFVGCTHTALTFIGGGVVSDNLFARVDDFTTLDKEVLPGAAIFLRGDERSPRMEGNVYFRTQLAGRVEKIPYLTAEEFARGIPVPQVPAGKLPPLRRGADEEAPGEDGALPPGHPLRSAATDGTAVGSRFDFSAGDPLDSALWVRRDAGRTLAKLGAAALDRGDRDAALALSRRASGAAPDDPDVLALAARLR